MPIYYSHLHLNVKIKYLIFLSILMGKKKKQVIHRHYVQLLRTRRSLRITLYTYFLYNNINYKWLGKARSK